MKEVNDLTPLDMAHDCGDELCAGGCPECGECVHNSFDPERVALLQYCLSDLCQWAEECLSLQGFEDDKGGA